MARKKIHELFVVKDKDTHQEVSVYAFAPFTVRGENIGGEFLVWTSHGWDFRPVDEFEPYNPKLIEFVGEEKDDG